MFGVECERELSPYPHVSSIADWPPPRLERHQPVRVCVRARAPREWRRREEGAGEGEREGLLFSFFFRFFEHKKKSAGPDTLLAGGKKKGHRAPFVPLSVLCCSLYSGCEDLNS